MEKKTVSRIELLSFIKEYLKPELFDDYCPNGLQVEGINDIQKIVFAVSATKETVAYAASVKAQALIVHHGLFWKFHGTKTITEAFYHRIAPLIKNDINLLGYHLPLDAHLEIGNAKSLALKLNLQNVIGFGNYKGVTTGIQGEFHPPIKPLELKSKLEQILDHQILYSNPETKNEIKSIGIITGGANSEWREAAKKNLDAYLTGEMSEHDYHESRESNIHMFAGGHHATEKFGIQMLMKKIQETFPVLDCEFKDSENPA